MMCGKRVKEWASVTWTKPVSRSEAYNGGHTQLSLLRYSAFYEASESPWSHLPPCLRPNLTRKNQNCIMKLTNVALAVATLSLSVLSAPTPMSMFIQLISAIDIKLTTLQSTSAHQTAEPTPTTYTLSKSRGCWHD